MAYTACGMIGRIWHVGKYFIYAYTYSQNLTTSSNLQSSIVYTYFVWSSVHLNVSLHWSLSCCWVAFSVRRLVTYERCEVRSGARKAFRVITTDDTKAAKAETYRAGRKERNKQKPETLRDSHLKGRRKKSIDIRPELTSKSLTPGSKMYALAWQNFIIACLFPGPVLPKPTPKQQKHENLKPVGLAYMGTRPTVCSW